MNIKTKEIYKFAGGIYFCLVRIFALSEHRSTNNICDGILWLTNLLLLRKMFALFSQLKFAQLSFAFSAAAIASCTCFASPV